MQTAAHDLHTRFSYMRDEDSRGFYTHFFFREAMFISPPQVQASSDAASKSRPTIVAAAPAESLGVVVTNSSVKPSNNKPADKAEKAAENKKKNIENKRSSDKGAKKKDDDEISLISAEPEFSSDIDSVPDSNLASPPRLEKLSSNNNTAGPDYSKLSGRSTSNNRAAGVLADGQRH